MAAPGTVQTIQQHYPDEFDTSWKDVSQQKPSRLAGCCEHYQVRGKRRTINIKGKAAMRLVTQVSAPTTQSTKTQYKRWINTLPYDESVLYDEHDDAFLGATVLPTSAEVRAHAYAFNRQIDATILTYATGNNLEGETGATSIGLVNANKVAVTFVGGVNTGLNTAKCVEVNRILMEFEAFDEGDPSQQRVIVTAAQQVADLLNDTEFISSDFNTVRALVAGTANEWAGLMFKRTELTNLGGLGTDIRRCVAWVKDGMALGLSERSTYMDILPSQSHSLQIRSVGRIGATRTEEEKVVEIACDESP